MKNYPATLTVLSVLNANIGKKAVYFYKTPPSPEQLSLLKTPLEASPGK
jgi:hypothetical protein